MGQITITTKGSFPNCCVQLETATIGGHAAAIGRAIEHLVNMLPAAIQKDHDLHDTNQVPPDAPFGHRVAYRKEQT